MSNNLVHANYDEKFLKGVTVTAEADDAVMTLDGVEVSYEYAKELFMKNLLVVELEGVYYRPVVMKEESSQMAFTALKEDMETVTALTFKSAAKA